MDMRELEREGERERSRGRGRERVGELEREGEGEREAEKQRGRERERERGRESVRERGREAERERREGERERGGVESAYDPQTCATFIMVSSFFILRRMTYRKTNRPVHISTTTVTANTLFVTESSTLEGTHTQRTHTSCLNHHGKHLDFSAFRTT
jgi:hypothetical protein